MSLLSTERFSSRVENYVRYRPSYPKEILEVLENECGLSASSTVADVGSGTGILTQLVLASGAEVYGLEPNAAMRTAGEAVLGREERFTSIEATAEATTLPDDSIDLIVAGQAFHWFNGVAARREFDRILRPNGWVALIWNERSAHLTPFLVGYERILHTYAPGYAEVDHRRHNVETLTPFFHGAMTHRIFANAQRFDFEGLQGRLLSSSYAPEPGHPNHEPMLEELRRLFEETQVDGKVDFAYDTHMYFGH